MPALKRECTRMSSTRVRRVPPLRTARAWLTWSCVRDHDPAHRLEQARRAADRVLLSRPADPEILGILAVALALSSGEALVQPEDPMVRARLGTLHRCIAELLAG